MTRPKDLQKNLVNLDDTRSQYPNAPGTPEHCFYCSGKLGEPHDFECVIPQKQVMIEVTITMPTSVPRSWTKEQIEFHRNESTWCADNWLEDLIQSKEPGCICPITTFRVVEDEE